LNKHELYAEDKEDTIIIQSQTYKWVSKDHSIRKAQNNIIIGMIDIMTGLRLQPANSKSIQERLYENQQLSDDSKEAIMTIVCLISVTILTLAGIAIITVYNQHYKKSTPILESEMHPLNPIIIARTQV